MENGCEKKGSLPYHKICRVGRTVVLRRLGYASDEVPNVRP